jgi:hypothetical protein
MDEMNARSTFTSSAVISASVDRDAMPSDWRRSIRAFDEERLLHRADNAIRQERQMIQILKWIDEQEKFVPADSGKGIASAHLSGDPPCHFTNRTSPIAWP